MRIPLLIAVAFGYSILIPPTADAQALAAQKPAAVKPGSRRPLAQIDKDIAALRKEIAEKLPLYKMLGKSQREGLAPTITPLCQSLIALFQERGAASTSAADKAAVARGIALYSAILAALGDADAQSRLDAMAKSDAKPDAARGKIALGLVGWWTHFGDAKAQLAALDEMGDAARLTEPLAGEAVLMIKESGNLTRDQEKTVLQFEVDHFKSPQLADARTEAQNRLTQLNLEGKPMTIAGRTIDNKDFTTANWKGKS